MQMMLSSRTSSSARRCSYQARLRYALLAMAVAAGFSLSVLVGPPVAHALQLQALLSSGAARGSESRRPMPGAGAGAALRRRRRNFTSPSRASSSSSSSSSPDRRRESAGGPRPNESSQNPDLQGSSSRQSSVVAPPPPAQILDTAALTNEAHQDEGLKVVLGQDGLWEFWTRTCGSGWLDKQSLLACRGVSRLVEECANTEVFQRLGGRAPRVAALEGQIQDADTRVHAAWARI
ncbi:unnamed protein product [Amoebophrya sp. A120]|nr:unnamed protein product [Amoebophrya sp. A120]|eukprot:GSA120T00021225001.1